MTVLDPTPTPTSVTSPATELAPERAVERRATARRYLMCPPTYFTVDYAINAWMDPSVEVDVDLAVAQWESLRRTFESLGHRVEVLEPVPGLPDMVFAANGSLVVDGRALIAKFAHPERREEARHHRAWLADNGIAVNRARATHEGEGDFLVVGDTVLAGHGFRTSPRAHDEARHVLGAPVVSLELVDPRFYHLDTALAVLDDETVAYYPPAFSEESRAVLEELYPDAVLAESADAFVLGLNAVSDGRHVVVADGATRLQEQLRERGFVPVPVDLSELLKGGGGVKCCTSELR